MRQASVEQPGENDINTKEYCQSQRRSQHVHTLPPPLNNATPLVKIKGWIKTKNTDQDSNEESGTHGLATLKKMLDTPP